MTSRTDLIDQRNARAVAALLDLPQDGLVDGVPLPAMWHLFHFLTFSPQSQIGVDGHPSTGEATPAGTRRMFAGGRVLLEPGLRIGDSVTATTDVVADVEREGANGKLRFVTHRTQMRRAAPGGDPSAPPDLVDERDIVYIPLSQSSSEAYREQPAEGVAPSAARDADAFQSVDVDSTLLFRFSALTHNAHRIHYDREYARDVEGYPGLVVHGPLQAVLMAGLAMREWGEAAPPAQFRYRLVAPLFEHQGLFVTATRKDGEIVASVVDRSGRTTAKGSLGTSIERR